MDYTIPGPTGFAAWQIQYFGSVTNPAAAANYDADGTGQNNFFKYVAGLNPTNASWSFVFNITQSQQLAFGPIAVGRIYSVQSNTNLTGGEWMAAEGQLVTNGDQVLFTDTNSPAEQMFYRVNIMLP